MLTVPLCLFQFKACEHQNTVCVLIILCFDFIVYMKPFFPFISGGSKGYYQNLLVVAYPVWILVLLFELVVFCLFVLQYGW